MIENEDNLKDLKDLLLEDSTVEEHEEYSKIFKDLGIDLDSSYCRKDSQSIL